MFENRIVGGVIPREFIPAIDSGIREASQSGSLGGFQVVDFKAAVIDGSYHEVDSSEIAFKIAGSMALKNALEKASERLLEPVMKVETIVPDAYLGDVVGDLNARRAKIENIEPRGSDQSVDSVVPLSEMFGYATDLRSKTQGRANYSMEPSHYVELPKNLQEEIVGQRGRG